MLTTKLTLTTLLPRDMCGKVKCGQALSSFFFPLFSPSFSVCEKGKLVAFHEKLDGWEL